MKKEITIGIIVIALIVITAIFVDTYYMNVVELREDEPDVVLPTPTPVPTVVPTVTPTPKNTTYDNSTNETQNTSQVNYGGIYGGSGSSHPAPISPIPEIGSFLLFTCGLVCLGFLMLVLKL